MSNTQILTRDAYGVTYADPTSPDYSVRFRTVKQPKSLNGVLLENYVTEIIVNDVHQISVGSVTANDTLSVRIRASGSLESQTRLKAILEAAAAKVSAWNSENVLIGFEPTTVPENPAEV